MSSISAKHPCSPDEAQPPLPRAQRSRSRLRHQHPSPPTPLRSFPSLRSPKHGRVPAADRCITLFLPSALHGTPVSHAQKHAPRPDLRSRAQPASPPKLNLRLTHARQKESGATPTRKSRPGPTQNQTPQHACARLSGDAHQSMAADKPARAYHEILRFYHRALNDRLRRQWDSMDCAKVVAVMTGAYHL